MVKKFSLHNVNNCRLANVFDYAAKLNEKNYFFHTFLFYKNICYQKKKKISIFLTYPNRYKRNIDELDNNLYFLLKNNIKILNQMAERNGLNQIIKHNISNKKMCNNINKNIEDKNSTDKNDLNVNNENKSDEKKNMDDIIDLELSDIWSKKTLLVNYKNNIFEIILNRPDKLNALNKDMVTGLLNMIKSLDNDKRCHMIVLRSINTTSFSSGSDVKAIIENKEKGLMHLRQLYLYINYLSKFKKNFLCIWNGYVMGGGLGISMYSKHRVIHKNVIFAMPENKIGFFPDIGSCYFFKKYFGRNIGLHLGLTSLKLNEADLMNFKVCTNYIENIDLFLNELKNIKKNNLNDFNNEYHKILSKYPLKDCNVTPVLTEELVSNINKYYNSANNLEELISKLKKDNNDFCKKLLSDINNNCYFSCRFWFSYFLYNYDKTLEDILDNDYKISQYFLYHTKTFETGVTEILAKKNKSFQWNKVEEIKYMEMENIEDILMNKNFLSIKDEFV
ncbi:3-hydroxyisobutyryl-coenzyme A hydrolase, putative [Plasmodium gallinaceum]|uniref:3-hydroxyisobutyryl-CoA hydrolase n=1 Tax=Plasmodium gallinaceum TaxID=5849 RepID=A0A1J1H175_PLAGA|nr:3-hydroxyisobutyryl-coenzyme A hydrolase, putative [Plasmodium gallinaceum]CRG97037.1 3-hydroxyisobutyryl-coenzyme A hydrolase, putative [Plasmodium gallinaceum]